jgi:hypothetical protein
MAVVTRQPPDIKSDRHSPTSWARPLNCCGTLHRPVVTRPRLSIFIGLPGRPCVLICDAILDEGGGFVCALEPDDTDAGDKQGLRYALRRVEMSGPVIIGLLVSPLTKRRGSEPIIPVK